MQNVKNSFHFFDQEMPDIGQELTRNYFLLNVNVRELP